MSAALTMRAICSESGELMYLVVWGIEEGDGMTALGVTLFLLECSLNIIYRKPN